MAIYEPPVSRLTTLGRPEPVNEWADYSAFGIGAEHVLELIRLLQDRELAWADSNTPDPYAQVHAWRALGQLKAEAAIEPLLNLLAEQEGEDWNDWVTEDVPVALGMIGWAALAPVVTRLEQSRKLEHAPVEYAQALAEIAKHHPELRDEVVSRLCSFLESAAENNPALNGFVVGDLLDLKASEAWPVIEKAFATGNVDESVVGDAADAKWELGLSPRPASSRRFLRPYLALTAKERAQQRARKKKAEKRKKKRRR